MLDFYNERLDIVKTEYGAYHINNLGNLEQIEMDKFYVQKVSNLDHEHKFKKIPEERVRLTRDYFYLEELNEVENHFIFGDFYPTVLEDGSIVGTIKYGVLRLKEDEKGNFIPMNEEVVFPGIFDEIYQNENRILTFVSSERMAYGDVNPNSPNYGYLLSPVVLTTAGDFDVEFDGYAECGFDDVTGYFARDKIVNGELSPSDLLTKEEVKKNVKKRNN